MILGTVAQRHCLLRRESIEQPDLRFKHDIALCVRERVTEHGVVIETIALVALDNPPE